MVIPDTSSSTPTFMRGRGLLPPSSVQPKSMSGRGRLPPSSVQPILMRGRGRLPPSPFPPIVRPGRGVFAQTANVSDNVQDKPVQISKLQGPGKVDTVEASEVIDYPAPVSGQDFILHIDVDNATVPPSKVIDVMKEAELISGTISETKLSSNTYLVSSGVLGSHELLFGAVRCIAHLLAYEPQHSGHRGRFAPGYSGFLCGMSRPTVARVLLRAEFHELTIVVSRSYSDDCKNVATTLNRASLKTSHQFHVKESCKCKEVLQPYLKTNTSDQDWSHFLQTMGVLFKNEKTEEDIEIEETPRKCCQPSLHKEVKSLVQSVNTSSVGRYQHPSQHRYQHHSRHQSRHQSRNTAGDKYFFQRFRLVSRYHPSLNLSETAWFSICPEEISKHIACRVVAMSRKLNRKVRILDPFCGAGGNIVQAALMDEVAYASDIDPSELQCAGRMAKLFNVQHKMKFKTASVFDVDVANIDAIICSPPWGGTSYLAGVYDLGQMEPNYNKILEHCSKITKNIAVLMPRNIGVDQVAESAKAAGFSGVEVELNLLADKVKTTTLYYGDLINHCK